MTISRRGAERGYAFEDRWSNAKVAQVASLLAAGYSSHVIADTLSDGTDPATIRMMARRWGLRDPKAKSDQVHLVVPFTVRQRANIHARAQQRGLSTEEYVRRLVVCASMPVDLFDAIVPEDQF